MVEPQYGDVICVNHGVYNHFGIFVDKNHVIHYSGKEEDFLLRKMVIRETDIDNFLGDSDKYYVYKFSEDKSHSVERMRANGLRGDLVDGAKALYLLYQIKNKVKFKIGERKFFLPGNNCEHFAIWCKTGVRQSYQVNLVLKAVFIKMDVNIDL